MKPSPRLTHEFVTSFPAELREGTVYVSMIYATTAHKCCCGCGQKVITPISPSKKAWKLAFDGESISLYPSIGNWNFACQSHYWIKNNMVIWEVDSKIDDAATHGDIQDAEQTEMSRQKGSLWQRIKKLWLR